ncbi:hydantoinase/oxoprolinase family protein [Conexibacter sp. CPCC 206217]|uniref:hydantoinase/oxoprolinase family protein n=1 Tax=Conexibacter sp. CPCC 206217 TaxID=3064574 RepID=UPI00271A3E9A|nr:hydantoinase/oxoprolinase family protein [Conexibacter sp. CPCC 206217]MDO8211084.1 hydantoinase/oxoprolinase family protein [Conexibacter sp. CPCC 206217]
MSSTSSGTATRDGFVAGVDIGGTFTDCVAVSGAGAVMTGKHPSTPGALADGFVGAMRAAADGAQIGHDDFFAAVRQLKHGSTVAINTIVSRTGARVGLLTTRGHGDAILIMRGAGRTAGLSPEEVLHVPSTDKPEPLVPRSRIAEIGERIDAAGEVVAPLRDEEVEAAVRRLLEQGVEAFAVCFLWSFANPSHEQQARAAIERVVPGAYVTLSSDLIPRIGEYERTAAAVMNAYVGPNTTGYIETVAARVNAVGVRDEIMFMQCSGGVFGAQEAAGAPIFTLQSGPVGGVVASRFLARRLGHDNVITADMGGTTFDVSVIRDGEPANRDTTVLQQYEIAVPTVDVQSIGAGGGSIAWIDPIRRTLRVGPQSAGAEPGPACYGRGGTQATVTDADVVQGFINPDRFLGGALALDPERSRAAIAALADQLGLTLEQTAAGITRIVDSRMADLIRKATIERGFDPRDFVLFGYGGAGPTHVGLFARELGVQGVVVPLGNTGAVWSALGVASADYLRIYDRVHYADAPFRPGPLATAYGELERGAVEDLLAAGIADDELTLQRSCFVRYKAQVHTVEVPVPGGAFTDAVAREVEQAFEMRYATLFGAGTGYREAGIEITDLRVTAIGGTLKPFLQEAQGAVTERDATAPESRPAYWLELEQTVETPVFQGAALQRGERVAGPAIVEFSDTTVPIRPGQSCTVDDLGNLVLTVPSGRSN